MRLKNKTAVISGACSGIGEATAIRFAQEGADLILGDIDESKADALLDKLKTFEGKYSFIRLDVRNETSWIHLFETAAKQFTKIDVVVNNAGVAIPGNVEDVTFENWNRELSVNLNGAFFGIKHGFKALKEHGGSIINLSSIEGIVGHPDFAAYSAGKAGVRNLTKSAALHAGKMNYKIRINSIHPGYIKTPMIGDDKKELDYLTSLHPIGHLGEPVDIANMALFLASDEAKFATGAEFVIDGGFLAK